MKKGDIIGIGAGQQVSLLCEVQEVTNEYIKFFVINGAWTGYLRGQVIEAGDEWNGGFHVRSTTSGQKIVYTGPVRGRDYNESIEFINQMIARNWLSRKAYVLQMEIQAAVEGYWRRFVRSCKAFNDAWHGRAAYDDTIPF